MQSQGSASTSAIMSLLLIIFTLIGGGFLIYNQSLSDLESNSNRMRRFDWISNVGVDISESQWKCMSKLQMRNFDIVNSKNYNKTLSNENFTDWQVTYYINKTYPYVDSEFTKQYSNGVKNFDNMYHFIDYPFELGRQNKVLMIEIPPAMTNINEEPQEYVVCRQRSFPQLFSVCDKQGQLYADFEAVQIPEQQWWKVCEFN